MVNKERKSFKIVCCHHQNFTIAILYGHEVGNSN